MQSSWAACSMGAPSSMLGMYGKALRLWGWPVPPISGGLLRAITRWRVAAPQLRLDEGGRLEPAWEGQALSRKRWGYLACLAAP